MSNASRDSYGKSHTLKYESQPIEPKPIARSRLAENTALRNPMKRCSTTSRQTTSNCSSLIVIPTAFIDSRNDLANSSQGKSLVHDQIAF